MFLKYCQTQSLGRKTISEIKQLLGLILERPLPIYLSLGIAPPINPQLQTRYAQSEIFRVGPAPDSQQKNAAAHSVRFVHKETISVCDNELNKANPPSIIRDRFANLWFQ